MKEKHEVLVEWITGKKGTLEKDENGNWDLDTLELDGERVENNFARIAELPENKTIWTIMDEDHKVLN